MRIALVLMVVGGCTKSKSADLSTPEGAARCQHAAITAKSVEAWSICFHPKLRSDVKAELAKKAVEPGFWSKTTELARPFATVKGADFTLKPLPPERADWGDQQASYRLPSDQDAFDVVRSEGRWYVVDTGI
jgi:hypothetical protein